MTPEFWAIIRVGVVVAGSHWSLHRDMASLRERMAKLEGAMDGFTIGLLGRTRPMNDTTTKPKMSDEERADPELQKKKKEEEAAGESPKPHMRWNVLLLVATGYASVLIIFGALAAGDGLTALRHTMQSKALSWHWSAAHWRSPRTSSTSVPSRKCVAECLDAPDCENAHGSSATCKANCVTFLRDGTLV